MRLPKPTRERDEHYLKWIRSGMCLCAAPFDGQFCPPPIDPHHVIPKGGGKTGSKVDDRRCVPLCRKHHDEAGAGRDKFEKKYGINFEQEIEAANRLYAAAFGKPEPGKKSGVVPRVRLPKIPQLKKLEIACHCGETHKIPVSKAGLHIDGGRAWAEYRCIKQNLMMTVQVA